MLARLLVVACAFVQVGARCGNLFGPPGSSAVFLDVHDGDEKKLTITGYDLAIKPYNNSQTWSIDTTVGDGCVASVNFDVPGKPNPPPIPLQATIQRMLSPSGSSKWVVEFTDPTGTLAAPTKPLNEWVQIA